MLPERVSRAEDYDCITVEPVEIAVVGEAGVAAMMEECVSSCVSFLVAASIAEDELTGWLDLARNST